MLSTREKVLYLSGVADAVRRVDQRNPTVLTTNMKWSTVLSGLTAEEVSLLLSDVDVLGLNLYPYWSGLRDDGREAFQYLTEVAEDGTAEAEKYGKKMWVIEIPIVSHANGGPQCLEAARWIVFIRQRTSVIGVYQLRGREFGVLNLPEIFQALCVTGSLTIFEAALGSLNTER